MTAKRIVAVVAAAVLIGAAFLLRRNVIEDDADATQSSAPVTTSTSQAVAVVCSSELERACTAIGEAHPELAVSVEPAGVTLDRLAELPDGAEAPVWLTVAPFPEMVDSLRSTSGLAPLGFTADVLAATQLVVATPTGGRAEVLASGCDTPLWRCLGEHASTPWTELGGEPEWRTVRPSLGVVDREAMALASFAAAVAGYFGTPEISSSMLGDPAFIAWLRPLSGAVDESALSAGTPLATMATRAGSLDVAATTAAEHAGLGARAEGFDASYPEPSMWLQAVLAVPGGAAVPDDLSNVAAAALVGWDDPSTATQPLPSASTMLALRTLWQEAT